MVEEKLMKDADKVDLTDGGETALHSHAGGGGGFTGKAGSEAIASAGDTVVTFTTPFADANYSINLSPSATAKNPVAYWKSKASGGFTIEASQGGGGGFVGFTCDWTAIPHVDP